LRTSAAFYWLYRFWISGGFVEAADKVRISVTNLNMSFLPSESPKRFFKEEA
jgi:hypothetical protein